MLVAHVVVTHRLGPARSQLSLAKLRNISFSIPYTLDAAPGWVHRWRPSPATCGVWEDQQELAEMEQPLMQINSILVSGYPACL